MINKTSNLMANSTNYYRNRELLSTKTFINYTTLTLTLYIYMDERHLRSPKKKKKIGGKGWEDKHRFHLLLSKLQQQHEKEKTNWRCLIAGQTKYKLSTQSKAFFMLIWCKSGCQQPNPRLLGEQETGGA
jgi:hypothetical protein